MKCLLLAATILFSCMSGRSQYAFPELSKGDYSSTDNRVVVSSMNGQTYFPTEYAKLASGTPFFRDQWMKAELIDEGGKVYTSNAVRMDLLSNSVIFRDPATGQEMTVSTPVKWIRLTDTVKNINYMFVLGDQFPSTKKTQAGIWFQVLVNKNVCLIHQQRKSVHEIVVYGEGPETTISTDDFYFLSSQGILTPITGWKDLREQLNDKKDMIDQYIHSHHLKGKAPEDYTDLLQYYNSSNPGK
jgi:hypothetical protein